MFLGANVVAFESSATEIADRYLSRQWLQQSAGVDNSGMLDGDRARYRKSMQRAGHRWRIPTWTVFDASMRSPDCQLRPMKPDNSNGRRRYCGQLEYCSMSARNAATSESKLIISKSLLIAMDRAKPCAYSTCTTSPRPRSSQAPGLQTTKARRGDVRAAFAGGVWCAKVSHCAYLCTINLHGDAHSRNLSTQIARTIPSSRPFTPCASTCGTCISRRTSRARSATTASLTAQRCSSTSLRGMTRMAA